jgi:beta-aspartyl-peptidase (threonine type)
MKVVGTILACTILALVGVKAQRSAAANSETEIRDILQRQVASWNAGDIPGYMEGYWKSDSLIFTSGGEIQRGWTATLEKYEKSYATKEKMGTLTFSRLEVYLLSPESAWCMGHWDLKRAGDHPQGVFTLVFRKFPDGWKIMHDHTSVTTQAQN